MFFFAVHVIMPRSSLLYKGHGFRLHCAVLILQVVALLIALGVGVVFILRANHVSAIKREVAEKRTYANGSATASDESLKSADDLFLALLCMGSACLVVASLLLVHLTQVVSLMLGPRAPGSRRLWCLEALRERIEDELLMLRAKREVRASSAAKMTSSDERKRKKEAKKGKGAKGGTGGSLFLKKLGQLQRI